MINEKEHPVAWPLLLMDLDDVREHLENLIKKMQAEGSITEEDFAVDMGHIYAHLNRIWNTRNTADETAEDEWEKVSQFPKDLKPIG